MAFTNPAGLWFMLGIPLLLLLFFLRPKFEEQNLSSTFLWRLSVKYRKKRMTVSRLRRLMILALQLLLILLLSLVLSGPRLMADGFGTDYVVILDTSASMAMTDVRGTSMLELALQDIHISISCLQSAVKSVIIKNADKTRGKGRVLSCSTSAFRN